MSDKELLEAAARAFWAGEIDDVCSVEWGEQDNCILYTHADNQDHNGVDRTYRWNPLEENSDAFELAVKLDIQITPGSADSPYAVASWWVRPSITAMEFERELVDGDRCAAIRRCIVRAAASIGPTP